MSTTTAELLERRRDQVFPVLLASQLEQLGRWPSARAPFLHEASIPGVFAVGDVRSGSVKRIASAVGEGSICVQFVHRVLPEPGGAGPLRAGSAA